MVTFEWGDEGSLAVDAVDAAHEGAPAAETSEPPDAGAAQACPCAAVQACLCGDPKDVSVS